MLPANASLARTSNPPPMLCAPKSPPHARTSRRMRAGSSSHTHSSQVPPPARPSARSPAWQAGSKPFPADVFAGAHYVALGHIHRPQTAGAAHIRYSGAPLPFGFDEEGNEKSMAIVDIGAAGDTAVELIPFRPLRGVRTLRGTLGELLALPPSDDFIKPILTDEGRLIDPMKRIRNASPSRLD